jgi:hypothetical protein
LGSDAEEKSRFPGFSAVTRAEFGEDRGDVILHRAGGPEQALRYFLIAPSLCQEAKHIDFARGEPGRVRAGGRAGPARHATDAKLA